MSWLSCKEWTFWKTSYLWMAKKSGSPVEVGSWSIIYDGFLYIPGGAAFLPSTVVLVLESFQLVPCSSFSWVRCFSVRRFEFWQSLQVIPCAPGMKNLAIWLGLSAWVATYHLYECPPPRNSSKSDAGRHWLVVINLVSLPVHSHCISPCINKTLGSKTR